MNSRHVGHARFARGIILVLLLALTPFGGARFVHAALLPLYEIRGSVYSPPNTFPRPGPLTWNSGQISFPIERSDQQTGISVLNNKTHTSKSFAATGAMPGIAYVTAFAALSIDQDGGPGGTGRGFGFAKAIYTDVLITSDNPSVTSATTSLNLTVDPELFFVGNGCAGVGTIEFAVSAPGLSISGKAVKQIGAATSYTGALAGWNGFDFSIPYTTKDFTVPVGKEFTFALTANTLAEGILCGPNDAQTFRVVARMYLSLAANTTSAALITGQEANAAPAAETTPVFNLPPGFTVNSVQAGIVDNVYVGAPIPEPGSLILAATGASLLALFGRYARRTAA